MAEKRDEGFLSNAQRDLGDIYSSIYEAVTHPARTAGAAVKGFSDLNAAQMDQYRALGAPNPVPQRYQSQQQQAAERGRGTALGVADRYGQILSNPGKELYQRPFSTAMDVGAVLDPMASVLKGRFPGAAKAFSRAAEIASAPVSAPARAVTSVARAVAKPAAKSAAAREAALAAANLHPSVAAHPKVREALDALAEKKGASPAVVKEAVLRAAGADAEGAPILRSSTTGEKPAAPANGVIATGVREANKEGIGARTASLVPEQAPDAVGRSFIQSLANGRKAVTDAFSRAYSNQGVLAPRSVDALLPSIEGQLGLEKNAGIPSKVEDFNIHRQYPVTKELLFGGRGIPGLARSMSDMAEQRSGLSLPEIEQFRKGIGDAWKKAKGDDRAALTAVRDAFDNWAEKSVANPDMFIGESEGALKDFADARKTFVDYKKTFENSPDANVRAASVKVVPYIEENALAPTAPEGLAGDVHSTLLDGVFDPKKMGPREGKGTRSSGEVTYNTLTAPSTDTGISVLPPEGIDNLHNAIKAKAYHGGIDSQGVETALSGPYSHIFAPDAEELRLQGAANDILGEAPTKKSALDKGGRWPLRVGSVLAGNMVGEGLGGLAGSVPLAGRLLKEGAGLAMGTLTGLAEQKWERGLADKAVKAETAGAPKAVADIDPALARMGLNAARIAGREEPDAQATNAEPQEIDPNTLFAPDGHTAGAPAQRAEPAPQEIDPDALFGPDGKPNAAEGQRTPHAAGGATGARAHVNPHTVDRLLNRLIKATKAARNDTKKSTEHLLAQDDATVAKALAIAKAAI